jgi:hypothetical protein
MVMAVGRMAPGVSKLDALPEGLLRKTKKKKKIPWKNPMVGRNDFYSWLVLQRYALASRHCEPDEVAGSNLSR